MSVGKAQRSRLNEQQLESFPVVMTISKERLNIFALPFHLRLERFSRVNINLRKLVKTVRETPTEYLKTAVFLCVGFVSGRGWAISDVYFNILQVRNVGVEACVRSCA